MYIIRALFLFFFFIILVSCSKDKIQPSVIKEKSLELQVLEAYNLGKDALEGGDVLYAAKKFNEAETLFPQSEYAPKSALMAAYSYYAQDYYQDSIAELKRFLRVYPSHKNISYVHYLIGICYFEQIVDEKKDLQSIQSAKTNFEFLIKEYPNTEYALDAEFKLSLIDDILAPSSKIRDNRDILKQSFQSPLKEARENFEKEYLSTQLKKHHGNISKTADFIGMERSALHRKLKSLGIKGIN